MDIEAQKKTLIHQYQSVRMKTVQLCRPLATEDYVIQTILDVSPPKWHLAHTTWFFETFILKKYLANYRVFDPLFHFLFNSYYHGIGSPYPRNERGLLARPTVERVYAYRNYVDQQIVDYLTRAAKQDWATLQSLIILGLNHEQQHQELLLMDVKHNFYQDPSYPVYTAIPATNKITNANKPSLSFLSITGGLVTVGHDKNGFCFDNELPTHQKFLEPYAIATRLTTNAEYAEFIAAGGYQDPLWWLADGWDWVIRERMQAPLYWQRSSNGEWAIFTLSGLQALDPNEPVSHISYFEADAYARWRGCRLPLEEEWENVVRQCDDKIIQDGNFMETELYHPRASYHDDEHRLTQLFGDLWEWTASPYVAYPGFKSLAGALGEYNGKFMNNQFVLRGGSCATPQSHIRLSYRNFFQPDKRWQFSGIRLAKDI